MYNHESKYLVESVKLGDQKGVALQSDLFFREEGNTQKKCEMSLYPTHVIVKDYAQTKEENSQIEKIHLSFDVIFQITKKDFLEKRKEDEEVVPLNGIKFQKFGQTYCLFNCDIEVIEKWRSLLSLKLNQRGFHTLFKPIKKIGKGNFASVYLATRLSDNLKCAVKAFSKQATFSEKDGKLSLINEIQVMRKLNHKNLMKLYGVYQSQNSIYVCLQLLEGGQLYDKIKSKYKFPSQKIFTIMRALLQGAVQMNQAGIMHRDLKPQNILFRKDQDYDCVIADFGLAQDSKKEEYLFVRCGTPGYVAPEVINITYMRSKIDPICDVFSIGIIFYILLFGESPFPGKTYKQVLEQNRDCDIQFCSQKSKKIHKNALNLLKRMLDVDPETRIPAQIALKHAYFKEPQVKYETSMTGEILTQSAKGAIHKTSILGEHNTMDSPLMTSANPFRKLNKQLPDEENDIKFVMKENVITGHVNSQQIKQNDPPSIIEKLQPAKKPKVSRFGQDSKIKETLVVNKEN